MAATIATGAATRLALRHPFWTEVFYSMTIREATPEEVAAGIKTEATDGRNLWINADFWKSIPLDQQVAELVHELYHKILLHPLRRGGRNRYLWNVACDYVINAAMKKQNFNFPTTGPMAWLYEPKYEGWLAESVYTDLMTEFKKKNPGMTPGAGVPGVPQISDGREDLQDMEDIDEPEKKAEVEMQIKAMVDRAITMAKAMGTLPAGIEAGVVEATKPSREPWFNHLHRFMQSLRSMNYNWARVNRRALRTHRCFAPMHYGEALGTVALMIDTSGSCYDRAQQANFTSHLNAIINEAMPDRVIVSYFDTQVYPGEEFEAGECDVVLKPKGGGGTCFRDLFAYLERNGIEPDVCIVLTDLCGSFAPEGPDYPLIWASVEPGMTAPYGEVIEISNE